MTSQNCCEDRRIRLTLERLRFVSTLFCILAVGCAFTSPQALAQGDENFVSEGSSSPSTNQRRPGFASGISNTVRGMFGNRDDGAAEQHREPKTPLPRRETRGFKPGAFQQAVVKQLKAVRDPNPESQFSVEERPMSRSADADSLGTDVPKLPTSNPSHVRTEFKASPNAQLPFAKPSITLPRETIAKTPLPSGSLPREQAITTPPRRPSTSLTSDPPSLDDGPVGTGVVHAPKPVIIPPPNRAANPSRLAEVVTPSQLAARYQTSSMPTRPNPPAAEFASRPGLPSPPPSGYISPAEIKNKSKPSSENAAGSVEEESSSETSESELRPVSKRTASSVKRTPSLDAKTNTTLRLEGQADDSNRQSSHNATPSSSAHSMPSNVTTTAPSNVSTTTPSKATTTTPSNVTTAPTTKVTKLPTDQKQLAPNYDLPRSNYSVTSGPQENKTLRPNANANTSINSPQRDATASRTTTNRTTTNSLETSSHSKNESRLEMGIPKVKLFVVGPSALQITKMTPYEVLIKNEGTESLSGVIVSVGIPASVKTSDAVTTAGEFEIEANDDGSKTLMWQVDTIGPAQTRILRLNIEASKAEHFALDLEWTVIPQSGQVSIDVEQAQLNIALEGPSEVIWGRPELYRLKVRNPGNAVTKNVQVKLTAEAFGSNESVIGDIPAGGERIVEVELTFQQTGVISIIGEASSFPNNLESKAAIDVSVKQIELEAQWTAPQTHFLGSIADYQIVLKNRSSVSAENILCSIPLPSGLTPSTLPEGLSVVGKEIRWRVPSINAASSATYNISFQATETTECRLRFDARCAGNGTVTSETVASIESISDLKLSVVDPVAPAPVGCDVQYDLVIINRGSRPAKSVKVVAQFSSGIEPLRVEGGSAKLVPGQVLFDQIESIGPGEQITLRVVAQATEAGVHRFRAELDCEDGDTQLVEEESTRYLATTRSDPAKSTIQR